LGLDDGINPPLTSPINNRDDVLALSTFTADASKAPGLDSQRLDILAAVSRFLSHNVAREEAKKKSVTIGNHDYGIPPPEQTRQREYDETRFMENFENDYGAPPSERIKQREFDPSKYELQSQPENAIVRPFPRFCAIHFKDGSVFYTEKQLREHYDYLRSSEVNFKLDYDQFLTENVLSVQEIHPNSMKVSPHIVSMPKLRSKNSRQTETVFRTHDGKVFVQEKDLQSYYDYQYACGKTDLDYNDWFASSISGVIQSKSATFKKPSIISHQPITGDEMIYTMKNGTRVLGKQSLVMEWRERTGRGEVERMDFQQFIDAYVARIYDPIFGEVNPNKNRGSEEIAK
jgi:hypothetical protein